jgi:hypothetical protein
MKIYTRVVIDMATSEVLEADWYDYDGPVAECKKGGKKPKTPDPAAVAAAQTQSNQDTASYNAALNRTNTYTPQGSSEFTVTGTDPSGAPIYRQDVKLAPDAQALYDQQMAQSRELGNVAQGMMGRVDSTLSQPLDTSKVPQLFGADDLLGARQQTQDALYNRQAAYLDPAWQQRESQLETQLANKGVVENDPAWNNARDQFNRERTFDYSRAREGAITGALPEMAFLADTARGNRAQGMNELYAERALPLNEFNALRASSQVDMPQFAGAAGVNMGNTDVAGNYWNAFDANMAKYNASQAGANNLMGGLFGLGSAALTGAGAAGGFGALFSDERLKENVEKVGRLPGGPNVYEYEMKGDPTDERQIGVMAQEVERTQPEAVMRDPSGYRKVDYAQVMAKAMRKGGRRGA